MFRGVTDRFNLTLMRSRAFRNGKIVMYYQPVA